MNICHDHFHVTVGVPEECGPFPLPLGYSCEFIVVHTQCNLTPIGPCTPPLPNCVKASCNESISVETVIRDFYGVEMCRFEASIPHAEEVDVTAQPGEDLVGQLRNMDIHIEPFLGGLVGDHEDLEVCVNFDVYIWELRPGPCPPEGCPPTTEVTCIESSLVYDSCILRVTDAEFKIPLPDSCHPPVPDDVSVICSVASCRISGFTTVPLASRINGLAQVTLHLVVGLDLTVYNADGCVRCSFSVEVPVLKRIAMYFQPEQTLKIELLSAQCFSPGLMGADCALVSFDACMLLTCQMNVKLNMPSYGTYRPLACVPIRRPDICTLT